MPDSIRQSPLYPIINPVSIVFFGASNRFTAMGTNQLNSLLSSGFGGKIYPIHPKETRVLDLKAYPRVRELPEVPDLAVLVLPTHIVPQVMEDCGKQGIKHAIVVSGGFKEVGGKGVELEKKLVMIADRYGLLAYFLTPMQSIRRTMTGMGIAEEEIPRLTEKLLDDQSRTMAGLIQKHQKPLVGFTFQSHQDLSIEKLLQYDVPVLPSPERASRAMAALVRYSCMLDKIRSQSLK